MPTEQEVREALSQVVDPELGASLIDLNIGQELVQMLQRLNPPSLKALWASRRVLLRGLAMRPKVVSRAPVQKVSEAPDLNRLPILKCWPLDGGRFITFEPYERNIQRRGGATSGSTGCRSTTRTNPECTGKGLYHGGVEGKNHFGPGRFSEVCCVTDG